MSTEQPDPKPEIHVDDDWKSRVKAEDAAQDEKLRQEHAEDPAQPSDVADANDVAEAGEATDAASEEFYYTNLPPVSFEVLVTMLSTQAMAALGLLADPGTGQPMQQLPVAKHFIDLLSVIEEKTKRNLTGREDQILQSSLHELRMIYVEMTKKKE